MAFIAKTKRHLRNEVGEIEMPARPTAMVIDMQSADDANSRNAGHGDRKTVFGSDVERISHVQFHDPVKGKAPRHIMILGEAGSGKSTISKMYCLGVADGNVKTICSVQLVHYVQAAHLNNRGTANAFDMLFTEQMAYDPMTALTVSERSAGANWLNENSDKLLLAIDGLDQCLYDFAVKIQPRDNPLNDSRVNKIITRIMGGNIWRGARILTTSRWNIYWDLTAEQKPNKVVGMRGFDDENLRLAVSGHSIDGDKMIDQLLNTSMKLLNLCRNPMFLKYTIKIFQTNSENLPDCISGLISAFFRNFCRLSPEKYDDITRLAYHGMLKNLSIFSRYDLENLRINPKDLNDFLSAGANPEKDQDTANSFDHIFAFSHQTMQEFCCALHISSLDRSNMERFISNDLNDNGMELTRQLFYGLILNDKVTNSMMKFMRGLKTSIRECREMLFEQLLSMVNDRTIRDIQTVRLLNECGDDTIRKMKQHVERVTIKSGDLLHSDQILLTVMIKRLSPLKTTFVQQIKLDPSMILYVKDCLESAHIFEVDQMTIQDKSMTHVKVEAYLDIFRRCKCTRLGLDKCDLTDKDFGMILRFCRSNGIKLSELLIWDGTMKSNVYSDVANIASITGCSRIFFGNCNLTKQKLGCFTKTCVRNQKSLSILKILDIKMQDKVYHEIAVTLKAICSKEIFFETCELTRSKLYEFYCGCVDSHLTLSRLSIWDGTMVSNIYRHVADIINITGCSTVLFGDCDLTKRKLKRFTTSCRKKQISLTELAIWDGTMKPDVYCDVADIINITGCSNVVFGDCDLTKQKLECFAAAGNKKQISLSRLKIADVKMPAYDYRELAITLNAICCKEIQFQNCELTRWKLSEFNCGSKDNELYLSRLNIMDSAMPPDAYDKVTNIVETTKCTNLYFRYCDMSKQKLESLGTGCKESHSLISRLGINWSYATATDDHISVLCDLMTFVVEELVLFDWEIDAKRRKRLVDTLHLQDSKIQRIQFPDGSKLYKRVSV